MQKQKNIRLLILLSIVIVIITLLPLLKSNGDGLSVDKKQYTLNQQIIITDVILTSDSINNRFSYINGQWIVNNTYEIDPHMRDVFFSVISQMEIRRSIPQSQNDSIKLLLKNKGIKVSILNNQELIKEYLIWGDKTTQTSYITDNTQELSYVLHIPGYRSYVAGIFQVPESDWRSRRIFTTMFTNLNKLTISYPDENINFKYKDRFFEIEGVYADSTQLISSLENLLFLQTEQYILPTELFNYIDSDFSLKKPAATITVTQLSGFYETVSIYEIENKPSFYVGLTQDSSYCLFNKKRLNDILVKKKDFN